MHLNGGINDHLCHVGRHHFDHGDLAHGRLHAHGVHHPRRLEGQQACLLNGHARIGDHVHIAAQLVQGLAKGHPLIASLGHQGQGALGTANAAHAVVDAARAQSALRDLEPPAQARDDVLLGHPHVVKNHLAVAKGLVVDAKGRQHALDLHARRVQRHQDHGVAQVAVGGGVGQPHEDQDLAVGVANAGAEPLAPIDHHLIALRDGRGGHVGRIGRGHLGLGHAKGRSDLAFQQRGEPTLLLRRRPVHVQHLHVAGVRRVAVEHLGGHGVVPHQLSQSGVFSHLQACTMVGIAQEQVPQTGCASLGLEVFHDGGLAPLTPVGHPSQLGVVRRLGRHDVVAHEGLDAFDVVQRAG